MAHRVIACALYKTPALRVHRQCIMWVYIDHHPKLASSKLGHWPEHGYNRLSWIYETMIYERRWNRYISVQITTTNLEVRRRIAMGKSAMGGLTSIWKDRGVTLETKVKLVKVLVFPIVLYGAETWTMRQHERRKIDAFELWCWRRVLRVSWMERKTNMSIIDNIKPEWTLESRVAKAALSYFGHVVRAGGMEDDVMLGRMNGARKRGRPRQRWVDTLKGHASGATISDMRRHARERAGWRGATTAVARGRMRLDGIRWQG